MLFHMRNINHLCLNGSNFQQKQNISLNFTKVFLQCKLSCRKCENAKKLLVNTFLEKHGQLCQRCSATFEMCFLLLRRAGCQEQREKNVNTNACTLFRFDHDTTLCIYECLCRWYGLFIKYCWGKDTITLIHLPLLSEISLYTSHWLACSLDKTVLLWLVIAIENLIWEMEELLVFKLDKEI